MNKDTLNEKLFKYNESLEKLIKQREEIDRKFQERANKYKQERKEIDDRIKSIEGKIEEVEKDLQSISEKEAISTIQAVGLSLQEIVKAIQNNDLSALQAKINGNTKGNSDTD